MKAQVMACISDTLHPQIIDFNDYNITFSVPRQSASGLPLQNPSDYTFLMEHATRAKDPFVNLIIEARIKV